MLAHHNVRRALAPISRGLLALLALLAVVGTTAGRRAMAQETRGATPPTSVAGDPDLPYAAMAGRVVAALRPSAGERALLRVDRSVLPRLEPALRGALEASGVKVETLDYGPQPDFAAALERASIYVWLPTGPSARPTPEQQGALRGWLGTGRGRQVHFHWTGITTGTDGFPVAIPPELDALHARALEVDYARLRRELQAAANVLRAGEIRVTTPRGTDLRFRIGDRAISLQDGDASREHLRGKPLPVDREVELPAGVLRVAPLEETVDGTLVVPMLRLSPTDTARMVRLDFVRGEVARVSADSKAGLVLDSVLARFPAQRHFRELGIGFNPVLAVARDAVVIPYAGYGAGVVRLSLGDNTELGGKVQGGASRWLFFPDATVTVGSTVLVKDGRLQPQNAR